MGRDYNSSKAGHNIDVRLRINTAFKEARRYTESGYALAGAITFSGANVHPVFLITNEYIPILEVLDDCTLDRIEQLKELRTTLVRSVMKAASEIAHQKFRMLSGEIIDLSDLIQEANISAYEGTLIYDVHQDAKWSTFIWRKMVNEVSKYVAENSRTVALPRTLLDQYIPIQEAISQVGSVSYDTIAMAANKINAEKKIKSSGRKLRSKEVYTPEKIEWFLQQVTEWTSLDMTVSETADDNKEVPLRDIIPDENRTTENFSEYSLVVKNLRKLLRECLSEVDYGILMLRWGLDETYREPLDTKETLRIFKLRYPQYKMHRARIKEIELRGMFQLQSTKLAELHTLWEALCEIRLRGDTV